MGIFPTTECSTWVTLALQEATHCLLHSLMSAEKPRPHEPVADQVCSGTYPRVYQPMNSVKHLLPELQRDHRPPHPSRDVTPHWEALHLHSYQVMRSSGTYGGQISARSLPCG